MKLLFTFYIAGNKQNKYIKSKVNWITDYDQDLYDKLNNSVYKKIYLYKFKSSDWAIPHIKSFDITIVDDNYNVDINIFTYIFNHTIYQFKNKNKKNNKIDQIISLIEKSNKNTRYIYYRLLIRCCDSLENCNKLIELLTLHINEYLNITTNYITKELENSDLYDDNILSVIASMLELPITFLLQYYNYNNHYNTFNRWFNKKANSYFNNNYIEDTTMIWHVFNKKKPYCELIIKDIYNMCYKN